MSNERDSSRCSAAHCTSRSNMRFTHRPRSRYLAARHSGGGFEKRLFGPLLEQRPGLNKRSRVDRAEPCLDMFERISRPLSVEAISEAVVEPKRCRGGRGHRTCRIGRSRERTRHDSAQGHSGKNAASPVALRGTSSCPRRRPAAFRAVSPCRMRKTRNSTTRKRGRRL